MNPRIWLYIFSSFLLTFAAGIAYLDRTSGNPPAPLGESKKLFAIIAAILALKLSGCITLDVSTRLPDGTKIRAGTNGSGATIEVSREF